MNVRTRLFQVLISANPRGGASRRGFLAGGFCLTMLAAAPSLGRAADSNAGAEKEVVKLSKQMTDAFVTGDMAFVDGVMADDWMIILGNGSVADKPQLLKDVKDGTLKYETLDKSEMRVRVYGEAAVVTGLSQIKINVNGLVIAGIDRFTEVYARQGGKWRCVSVQISPVAAQAGEKP